MAERSWVKAINKRLRDDVGDCPNVPLELLDLLRRRRAPREGASTVSTPQSASLDRGGQSNLSFVLRPISSCLSN